MKKRLYAIYNDSEFDKEKKFRKDQIGSGNLGEKIRTYNWPNNRITDHRLGVSKFGIDAMLSGELLEEFIDELIELERDQKLREMFGEEALKRK